MNAKWKLLLWSTVSGAVLSLSGCAPECEDKFDCADKGPNYTCSAGKCVETSGAGGGVGALGGGVGTTGGGSATTGGGDGTTGGGDGTTGGGDGTTGGGSATTGGGDGTTGGGSATTGGGDGTTGGGSATTGGGVGTTGGGDGTTGGGVGTTGGGVGTTGGGDGTTGGGVGTTGGGVGTTGGGVGTTGGGVGTTGGGVGTTGGGVGTTGGGAGTTGGGVGTTGGGVGTTGGGVGTTGGGVGTTGGGVGTTGGGVGTTGGGVGTTGGGSATTGGGTGTTGGGTGCITITQDSNFFAQSNGSAARYDALFLPELADPGLTDVVTLELYAPTTGTYDLSSGINATYADCEQCVTATIDEGDFFFAHTSGTLTVTGGDPLNGVLSATLTNVTLVELDANLEPVVGGACLFLPTATINVAPPVDAGVPDAGDVDAQIAQVRADATAGSTSSTTIQGALVTYLKPNVAGQTPANDSAGFFIQGTQGGPALYVALDPSDAGAGLVDGPVEVGDRLNITVTTVGTAAGLRRITGVSSITHSAVGVPVTPLLSSVSNVAFFDTGALDSWESKFVSYDATVTGSPGASGGGYSRYAVTTAGTTDGGTNFALRVPTAVSTGLTAQAFGIGCTFTVTGAPVWRFNNATQLSVWGESEITNITCPAPTVTAAAATSASTVTVNFSRPMDSATVTVGGFSIDNGVTVLDAGLSSAQVVTLQTSAMTTGSSYTVTAGAGVTDLRGTAVGSPNSATFTYSAGACAANDVVISALYTAGGNNGAVYNTDFVELHNRSGSPATLTNWTLQYGTNAGTSNFAVQATINATIPAGGYYLVTQTTPGANGTALPVSSNATGNLGFGAANGIVALVNGTSPVMCGNATIVDLVGYGSATCNETASTGALSTTNAAYRNNDRCQDLGNNSSDFGVSSVAATAPRNASTTANTCSCP